MLQALVDKHPHEIVYVAWDNASTHEDDEIEAVVRGAAGRLVLLYLPTYSPWLNPTEMLWRHFRREVTHCRNPGFLPALQCSARSGALHHRLQCRKIYLIALKCGPDYIDPMFYREVLKVPSHNLDPFFLYGRCALRRQCGATRQTLHYRGCNGLLRRCGHGG